LACWAILRLIEQPYCEVLGVPFSHDLGAGILSADAIANPPSSGCGPSPFMAALPGRSFTA
jgi:hypothetical protein